MEHQLLKIARQIDSFDEASLMALWERYAAIVSHFEPTKRWEEAALVLSIIQAKRWKNQLFNQQWLSRVQKDGADSDAPRLSFDLEGGDRPAASSRREAPAKKRGELVSFGPIKERR